LQNDDIIDNLGVSLSDKQARGKVETTVEPLQDTTAPGRARRKRASDARPVQDIVHRVEEDIVFRVYHPRERLVEDELMQRFDAKRHVIRQALA